MVRKNGRNHGEVFTKLNVVDYILDEVNYLPTENLENVRILEPACGQGAFALEIIKRLAISSSTFNFNFIKALNDNVRLIEINELNFEWLKKQVFSLIQNLGFSREHVNDNIFCKSDFLQTSFELNFDCIVGNPPYIRHELIENSLKSFYKKEFVTFKYRADLYVLFYEKSLKILAKKGILSFICSNRWLFNQYGKPLRKMIAEQYHLSKLINAEKANFFDENVIAYPCISTIKNSKGNTTKYYESQGKEININCLKFKDVATPQNEAWQNLYLNYNINHCSLSGILEQGFEVGIGVATGADRVFIKKESELNGIEKSRLMPLIKSNCLKGENLEWDNSYVLNPFDNGELCDLNNFPHLKEYFIKNKNVLINRHIVKKQPKNWYKTIDKIKPDLKAKYKLLLPDLSGSKFLFIDEGQFYPHHNVYYITHQNLDDLKVIACMLMSDFIKNQLSQIGIRMNGGLPRFQSQTLKKIRIPDVKQLKKLTELYESRDIKKINEVINTYCSQHSIC